MLIFQGFRFKILKSVEPLSQIDNVKSERFFEKLYYFTRVLDTNSPCVSLYQL